MGNNQQKYINITSHNQQGGITANEVSISTPPPRHVNDEFIKNLKQRLPGKNETIKIYAIANHPEAFHFASEIRDLLINMGYGDVSFSSLVTPAPYVGNVVESRKGGGINITIGPIC